MVLNFSPPLPLAAPSPPQNVNVNGVSSFALDVTWDSPLDNGGRPVTGYIITVNETEMEAGAMDRSLRIRNDEILMQNTTYE